jgi:hypothetical protein
MKNKFLFSAIAALLLFAACAKDDTSNPIDPVEPDQFTGAHAYEGTVTVKIGGDSETIPDGTIDIDLDEGTFELFALGDEMDVDISFDAGYAGKGTYTLSQVGAIASGSDKDFETYDYDDGAGFVTITENTAERIVGSYEFKGLDFEDHAKTVKGTFDMKKQ